MDLGNEQQPDALLLIDPERGGQCRISEDDYLEGAPELLAEVSASSAAYDLDTKRDVYQRNGVRETIVWRVPDRAVDWFALRSGRYERLVPDAAGVYRSEVFPGLWLDGAALVRQDVAAVLAALQQGLDSPEHTAFVAHLNQPT